jgi:hypothetical protein
VIRRKLSKLGPDLVERKSDPLRKHDERNPPQHRPRVAALSGANPFGVDEPPLLIEAQS